MLWKWYNQRTQRYISRRYADTRPEKCQFNQLYLKKHLLQSTTLEDYYLTPHIIMKETSKKKTLVWLLLYCTWPDLEITLQALSLLHWIKYSRCTDILWENTHRMHVIKVQNSIPVSSFRAMPGRLNSPVTVLQLFQTNRSQTKMDGGENSQIPSWQ